MAAVKSERASFYNIITVLLTFLMYECIIMYMLPRGYTEYAYKCKHFSLKKGNNVPMYVLTFM